jgi:hypothetical protein
LWDSKIKCAIKKGSYFTPHWDVDVVYNMCVFFVYNMLYLVYQGSVDVYEYFKTLDLGEEEMDVHAGGRHGMVCP